MSYKEIKLGEKQLMGEGGLDLIMTGVGFVGPYGWVVSSAYFIGKEVLEHNKMDIWNR